MQLEITAIRTDGGTQPRAELDQFTIDEYADNMANGDTFPPVTVFYDGADYWLADGFHRLDAHKSLGLVHVEADVRQGAQRDAVLFSVSANHQHGKRRTNADKRRAVLVLLGDGEWVKWSDREIARQCKVSNDFVSRLRKSLSLNDSERTYTTKHGTTATMDTSKIGKAARDMIKDTPLADNPQAIKELSKLPADDQLKIASVASRYEVTHAETIPFMHHHLKRNSETWGEIEKSGVVQPGEESEAVYINDHPLDLASATRYKSDIHAGIAMDVKANHQLINQSISPEWYTPSMYVEAGRRVMGGFDIDPASCEQANQTIQATTYYTKETNGLDKDWAGRCWINPPYGGLAPKFIARLEDQYQAGSVTEAIAVLSGNSLMTVWFAPLWKYIICFPSRRINFENPEGIAASATHGTVFVYLGPQEKRFYDEFKEFGCIMKQVHYD